MTDDQIRQLRRSVSRDSEEWAICTKALHATDPGDRAAYRWRCERIVADRERSGR